jgi:tetraacyldisaccharide 4'-kinase
MPSDFLIRSFRILLFPFALLYGLVIHIRNWLYNKKIFKAVSFNIPIINIGNLTVGGTGKSPMVEFLVRRLQQHYQIAVLSRGYRRKTKGYILAGENTGALEIGDEPFMFYRAFPGIAVAVGEDRVLAVPQLLQDRPETELILLDDAFQHRAIEPGCHILLTDFHNLYTDDFFLPTGDLRDQKSSAKRAAIIVVTKCPDDLEQAQKEMILKKLHATESQKVFFSTVAYSSLIHLLTGAVTLLHEDMDVLLVTGIANPQLIEKRLLKKVRSYEKLQFRDHHVFTIEDLRAIEKQFAKLTAPDKIILTTQKDAMRLLKFGDHLKSLPIFILPITVQILFEEERLMMECILDQIKSFSVQHSGETVN